ncbi:prolyl oligopeptidase family serine peptidase [Yoonia sp. R2-816]|uniref:prolyl oligopeptidase family serine peptidase n=1 Tax=Yoonia sp. R2-816 TaxID=3342638 RepID=UPI0037276F51
MTDIFPELEADADAIARFTKTQVARTEAAFCDAQFDADVARVTDIIEDPDNLGGLIRRGTWIYNFHRSATHPRGLWRRLPETTKPAPDADWQPVFDLDAFCADTGEDWHWGGAETLYSNPDRVLIILSFEGSDRDRLLEWDCNAAAPVPDGFDIAPARCGAAWLDANTILLATADLPGAATRSGWQGRVIRLQRGMALAAAPVVFEVDHDDLLATTYTISLRDGGRGIAFGRIRNIGDMVTTLHLNDQDYVLDAPAHTMCSHNDTHFAYVAADEGPDPAGTLVLARIDGSDKRILFEPSARRAVNADTILFTRDHLFWVEQDTLEPTLMRQDLTDPSATATPLPLPVEAQSIWIMPFDAEPTGTGPLQILPSGFLSVSQVWTFGPDDAVPDYTLLTSATETFDSTGMEVRLHMATSDDGTEIPYHIVLPKDHAEKQAKLPVLQYGYGGFGVALSPGYQRVNGPLWLERGGAYVQAYIRGGAEFGKGWHLAAKGKNRIRALQDFAAVATDLVTRGYTTPDRIACHGGSNGGLLCGVMLTRYPDRFGAVWASVGVLDMLRFHLFPAGAGWIDEYGDPDDPDARQWLLDYSPLHNVAQHSEQPYPPALIDTNESDDRVDPSHSRRFAAALQAAGQPGWFHSRSGGHGGGGQSKGIAREEALGFAFLRHSLPD